MFVKIYHTNFPPLEKPLMVYDGNCGFCMYWIIKWMKITKLSIDYKPFQDVSQQFKDIPIDYFKSAVRYIDTKGKINSGPDAAYITYYNQNKVTYLHKWYKKQGLFMKTSDLAYQWIANHRNFMFSLSVMLFGKNPSNPKPYWKIYLSVLLVILASLIYFLSTST